MYVTYFGGDTRLGLEPDNEAQESWISMGLPPHRVFPFGMKDNLWEMGDFGPGELCSEIHFYRIGDRYLKW